MINLKEVFADFQFVDHHVTKMDFSFPDAMDEQSEYDYDFDYQIIFSKPADQSDESSSHLGVVDFTVQIATLKNESKNIFLTCTLEAIFIGNPEIFEYEQFKDMLTVNGVATLSQLTRTHIMNFSLMSGITPPLSFPMINIFGLRKAKQTIDANNQSEPTRD
jgi:hypothetical protein